MLAQQQSRREIISCKDKPEVRRDALQTERSQIEIELARLTAAVASGGSLTTLRSVMHEREERMTKLKGELAALDCFALTPFNPVMVEDELRSYLTDWSSLAHRHPTQMRQILRKPFPNRIRVWREVCLAKSVIVIKEKQPWLDFSMAGSGLKALVSPIGM